MMPTYSERQELARQFAIDIARMQHCLQTAAKQANVDDIVYAWADYSDAVCAGWLTLPENEDATPDERQTQEIVKSAYRESDIDTVRLIRQFVHARKDESPLH